MASKTGRISNESLESRCRNNKHQFHAVAPSINLATSRKADRKVSLLFPKWTERDGSFIINSTSSSNSSSSNFIIIIIITIITHTDILPVKDLPYRVYEISSTEDK